MMTIQILISFDFLRSKVERRRPPPKFFFFFRILLLHVCVWWRRYRNRQSHMPSYWLITTLVLYRKKTESFNDDDKQWHRMFIALVQNLFIYIVRSLSLLLYVLLFWIYECVCVCAWGDKLAIYWIISSRSV